MNPEKNEYFEDYFKHGYVYETRRGYLVICLECGRAFTHSIDRFDEHPEAYLPCERHLTHDTDDEEAILLDELEFSGFRYKAPKAFANWPWMVVPAKFHLDIEVDVKGKIDTRGAAEFDEIYADAKMIYPVEEMLPALVQLVRDFKNLFGANIKAAPDSPGGDLCQGCPQRGCMDRRGPEPKK